MGDTGRIKGELRKKKEGYGFIKCYDGSPDCFMLPTSLLDGRFDDLREGQQLEFEAYMHTDERTGQERGRRARNITIVAGM